MKTMRINEPIMWINQQIEEQIRFIGDRSEAIYNLTPGTYTVEEIENQGRWSIVLTRKIITKLMMRERFNQLRRAR